jgi:hypothetical protein
MRLQALKLTVARLWPARTTSRPVPSDDPPPHALATIPDPTPAPRRSIGAEEALAGFVAWMNDHGFAGRWWPSIEIVGFYTWYCFEAGIDEMNPDALLALLRAPAARFSAGRRRLNQPMFDELRAYLARLPRRGEGTRAVLYRPPLLAEIANSDQPLEVASEAARAEPGQSEPERIAA